MTDNKFEKLETWTSGAEQDFEYSQAGGGNAALAVLVFQSGDSQPHSVTLKRNRSYLPDLEMTAEPVDRLELRVTGEWEAAGVIQGLRWFVEKLVASYGEPGPVDTVKDVVGVAFQDYRRHRVDKPEQEAFSKAVRDMLQYVMRDSAATGNTDW